jgi:hypothetical protein
MFIYSKINAGYHAGNITYSWLYGYTYQIKLTTFTGIGGGLFNDYCQDTLCFGDGTGALLLRSNGPIVGCAPAHDGVPINPNINLNEYVTTHSYPGPGNYTICFEGQNRNAGVINIPNSVNNSISFFSLLVIPAFGSGKNNSSVFANHPISNGCLNNGCFTYNPSATDPDGDSLSYEIAPCKGTGGIITPGYTYPSTGAGGTFSINTVSGTLIWCNPQIQGDYNVVVKITEWRKDDDGNYYTIGYVERDTELSVSNCTSINEEKLQENNVTIFPNPTNNFTTIQLSSKEKYSFQLYDMAGKLLSVQNCSNTSSYILNIENFAEGIYFLKITGNDNSTITKKIIKQ